MEVFPILKRIVSLILSAFIIAAASAAIAQDKPEFRAMWVSSYGTNCDMATPEGIDKLIAQAKLANLNALVLQVRKTGDAFYKSDTEPRAEDLLLPDFDPLAYAIEKAHAAGIEVHAWLNTYKVWAGDKLPRDPNHVYNKHPEWVNKTIYGNTDKSRNYGLDPGIPEVQEYTCKVYMDVVKKYDVDGIHFDYCRYWDPSFGYSDLAVARFNKETGRTGIPKVDDPVWCNWRRDRITDLVRQVYEEAKAIKPWVRVTGSVVGNHPEGTLPMDFTKSHPYNLLLQDWERWTREGIIDAVFPMNYKQEFWSDAAKAFREMTDGMVRWKHDRHAYNGLSVQPPDNYGVQVNESRTRGTDGTCGFAFNALGRYRASRPIFSPGGNYIGGYNRIHRGQFALALRQNLFPTWVPTPPMPWKAERPAGSGGPVIAAGGATDLDSCIYSAGVEGAITLLKEAIQKSPGCDDAHYRLGRCYRLKGMDTEAKAEFEEVLKIDPSHIGASAELGLE